MAKGRIAIDETYCKGCGYCAEFCPKGCIEMESDRFNSQGYMMPLFKHPEKCTACGVCVWMCPSMNIEVYKEA